MWKWAKIVNTQITRNTQEPRMTITVGATLFPIPREAAMEQSINAEIAYEKAMMESRSFPAWITAGSVANRDKNPSPNKKKHPPRTAPIEKAYVRQIK